MWKSTILSRLPLVPLTGSRRRTLRTLDFGFWFWYQDSQDYSNFFVIACRRHCIVATGDFFAARGQNKLTKLARVREKLGIVQEIQHRRWGDGCHAILSWNCIFDLAENCQRIDLHICMLSRMLSCLLRLVRFRCVVVVAVVALSFLPQHLKKSIRK